MSEDNLQADGQAEKPAHGAVDQQETEEEDSSPHDLPTSSPVQRLPLRHINTKHCLEIRVTLTDELGDVSPPSHAWMAPVVEVMLQEARAGLTEAVVIGPGRAILFYGRHSMGEGLKVDKARDATFLLTGAGTLVGKLAYLTANPMAVQEGRRAIAQAILDNRVKARGPGHLWVNPQAQQPFKFNTQGPPHLEMCLYTTVLMMNEHLDCLLEAKGIIGDKGTSNLGHPGSLPLPQTMVSKVIGVHYPWHLQCHPGWTAVIDLDALDEGGGIEKKCI